MQSLADSLQRADEASQTSDASLAKAQALQAALATGLMAISSSLQLSLSELNASKASADDYRQLAEQQIADLQRERRIYQYLAWTGFGAGLGGIAGGAAGGGAGAAVGVPAGALLGAGARLLGDFTRAW